MKKSVLQMAIAALLVISIGACKSKKAGNIRKSAPVPTNAANADSLGTTPGVRITPAPVPNVRPAPTPSPMPPNPPM